MFLTKVLLIPHSNMFVESMFSHVNAIKTCSRNLLNVTTVSDLMQIKSFYLKSSDIEKEDKEKEALFEPTEEHYKLYKACVRNE